MRIKIFKKTIKLHTDNDFLSSTLFRPQYTNLKLRKD